MIVSCSELRKIRAKHIGEKIVLVKGSFDLFHIGHLRLLQRSKLMGDILVVIVKCNDVVKLKASNRPIIDEVDRALIVDSLDCTDYCIVANEKNTVNIDSIKDENEKNQYERYSQIIKDLRPDILIKQPNRDIPNSLLNLYMECSTKIVELERTEGISTTEIINKIRG